MKLTLIKPRIGRQEHSLYIDEARMEPLQIGVLAALTPPDVEVFFYDDRMEPVSYDEPTDLVALTVETFTARRAYEISMEFRSRGVRVIMGGMHPTLLPEEATHHADAVYIGDAESLWQQVIADARRGKLRQRYQGAAGIPHPGLLPRRDIFIGKGYLPVTLLQFGRGCRFECNYCVTSVYFNKNHYYRDIREVIREIETREHPILFFVDDNILSDFDAAKALFRELIPLKIRWVSQASLDMTLDRELMTLMVKSGCLGHVVGFESIEPHNLAAMKKIPNLAVPFDRYKAQLRVLRDYGLQTWAAFSLGHDHDTLASIERTVEFAIENRFPFAAFNVLIPYPATPLYRRLQAEGRLLYDGRWWLHPEYRFNYAAFRPKLMSAEELTEAAFRARKIFNSPFSVIRRAFDLKTNMRSLFRLATFLRYAPLFRKDVYKKQGLRLGMESGEVNAVDSVQDPRPQNLST